MDSASVGLVQNSEDKARRRVSKLCVLCDLRRKRDSAQSTSSGKSLCGRCHHSSAVNGQSADINDYGTGEKNRESCLIPCSISSP